MKIKNLKQYTIDLIAEMDEQSICFLSASLYEKTDLYLAEWLKKYSDSAEIKHIKSKGLLFNRADSTIIGSKTGKVFAILNKDNSNTLILLPNIDPITTLPINDAVLDEIVRLDESIFSLLNASQENNNLEEYLIEHSFYRLENTFSSKFIHFGIAEKECRQFTIPSVITVQISLDNQHVILCNDYPGNECCYMYKKSDYDGIIYIIEKILVLAIESELMSLDYSLMDNSNKLEKFYQKSDVKVFIDMNNRYINVPGVDRVGLSYRGFELHEVIRIMAYLDKLKIFTHND